MKRTRSVKVQRRQAAAGKISASHVQTLNIRVSLPSKAAVTRIRRLLEWEKRSEERDDRV